LEVESPIRRDESTNVPVEDGDQTENTLRAVTDRIERLVVELRLGLDPATWRRVEETLALVTELYGAGLVGLIRVLERETGGQRLLARLAEDELLSNLLATHGALNGASGGAPTNLRSVGDRLEGLVHELRSGLDQEAWWRVEEAIGLVTELYGEGIGTILGALEVWEGGHNVLAAVAQDELLSSLLVLHGLHPQDLPTRINDALDSVRPYLGSHGGDVEVLKIDEAGGTILLRLLGSCDGCPSSVATLQGAVEQAIYDAAPEIDIIDVDEPEPPDRSVPIALGRKPTYEACPSELSASSAAGS